MRIGDKRRTDEVMAEEYVDTLLNKDDAELDKFLDENLGDLKLTKKQAGTLLGIIKGVGINSYLAGLKAGRPQWHKVADGDFPKEKGAVLSDKGEFVYYNSFSKCLVDETYSEQTDVIAWCEIPKYTKE